MFIMLGDLVIVGRMSDQSKEGSRMGGCNIKAFDKVCDVPGLGLRAGRYLCELVNQPVCSPVDGSEARAIRQLGLAYGTVAEMGR